MTVHRQIASKVAGALSSSSRTSQGEGEATQAPGPQQESLVEDMAALADTQIRYELEARLLRDAYEQLRRSIRSDA
jgi:hypothetical protein